MGRPFNPFADAHKNDYQHFQMDKITEELKFTREKYKKALQLISEEKIWLEKVELCYIGDHDTQCCIMIFDTHDGYSFYMRFDNKRIDYLYKTVSGYQFWSKFPYAALDEYETAVLLLADDYIRKNNPGDATNRNAAAFLSGYYHSADTVTDSRKKTVQLIPMLYLNDEAALRLMIQEDAHSRPYVVRHIENLLEAYHKQDIYPLGRSNQIDFGIITFAEECTQLLKHIKKWLREDDEYQYASYGYYSGSQENAIRLTYDRLDTFFELYKNVGVLNAVHKKTRIDFIEKMPRISVNIDTATDENGQFIGISLRTGTGTVYEGGKASYFFDGSSLYKIDSEYAEKLSLLLASSYDENDSGLQIGRKNLAEFYYHVLPDLRRIAAVHENDSGLIEQFLPPEAAFCFCLDILDDNTPECRIETFYGETSVDITDLLTDNYLHDGRRDVHSEQTVLKQVLNYFPQFQQEHRCFLADGTEDMLYYVIENAVPQLMQYGEVRTTQRFNRLHIRPKTNISIGISVKSNLLDLTISAADIPQEELLDIIKSYRLKKKYHRLKDGDFINLDESIEELSVLLETMHIPFREFVDGKMQLPAYRALYLDKMLEQNQEIYSRRDSHYKTLIKNFKTVAESDFEVPDSLSRTMRSYQHYGYKWLRTLENCGFGGILADDMGLGKTLQMISVLLAAKTAERDIVSIIVCPASLVYNWAAEFEKFAPQLKVCAIAGVLRERKAQIADYRSYDAVITSYDLIKRDIAEYENCEFGFQVLDEAQFIKNHTTAAAKAVKLIHAEHRFALTGTPIENRLSELWSIFDYLMPGFLFGYEVFKKEFETPIVKHSDEAVTEKLSKMTSPFILRRKKQDVLRDLPDKLEENYVVSLPEEQRRLYDAKVLELRKMLDEASEEGYRTGKLKVLAFLTQIRQICCDPSLIYENYSGGSVKSEACMELIERAIAGEHRMLVFSQFTSMLELLENELNERKIPYYKITGETPKKQRLELVEAFNSNDVPVFLISLKAGGTGLNLVGADVVVHYDPWWNVAAQNQATDRAHRIGQSKKVTVYKLIAKDTIEEKIQLMQEKKKALADAVITGETVNLSSLSKEDLLEILGT